jgi:hypothetical protein
LEIFITTDPNFKGFPEFISSGDALWTHFVIENKPPMKKVYNSEDFFDSFGSNLWVARFWVTVDASSDISMPGLPDLDADGGRQPPDPDEEPWRAGRQARKMNF